MNIFIGINYKVTDLDEYIKDIKQGSKARRIKKIEWMIIDVLLKK